jgi:hypothetical protein
MRHFTLILAAHRISGAVTDPSGAPLAGASVRLIASPDRVIATCLTGANGRYDLPAVTAGSYTLEVSAAGYYGGTETVTIGGADEMRHFTLILAAHRISGAVTDPSGAPLAGAAVRLIASPDGVIATYLTGANGRYDLPAVPAGSYTLEVSAAGYYGGTETVTIGGADETRHFTLIPVTRRISGTVTDASGVPLAGASVTLIASPDRVIETCLTNANGWYDLPAVPAGNYSLEVSAAGYYGGTEAVTIDSADETRHFTLTLTSVWEATLRYETVPISGGPQLLGSVYDDDNYYYVYVLGHTNRVPLTACDTGSYHRGGTNLQIGYSVTDITETSIRQALEETQDESFTSTYAFTWEFSSSFGMNDHYLDGKIYPVVFSVASNVSEVEGSETMIGRSLANTYETLTTESRSVTQEMSITIGEKGEPTGKYHFALFATTDVYGVVVTDHQKKTKVAYTTYAARPHSSYWDIDYEPDFKGTFGKTAPGDLLQFPSVDPSSLPTPGKNATDLPGLQRAAPPVADKPGGEYRLTKGLPITLSCANRDAGIYYTLDGTEPKVDGTNGLLYGGSFTITKACTLKAIAIADGTYQSEVMTVSYTELVLQTQWYLHLNRPDGDILIQDDGGSHSDYIDLTQLPGFENFDADALKDEGYTGIRLYMSFEYLSINYGYVQITIRKGHGETGSIWYQNLYDIPDNSYWTLWVGRTDVALSNFDTKMTLIFSADGDSDDNWMLSETKILFVATKPGYQ